MRALLLAVSVLLSLAGPIEAVSPLGPITRMDHDIARAVQAHRTPWLERPMRLASDSGKPVVVFGLLLGIAVLDAAEGVTVARVALVAAAAVNLVVEGTKRLTNRTRPDGESKRSNASFPSSHSANAFMLAAVLSRRWPRGLPVFLALAACVAASRMYLNRHFASDVVVGALLGAGLALLVANAMNWRRPGAARPARAVVRAGRP